MTDYDDDEQTTEVVGAVHEVTSVEEFREHVLPAPRTFGDEVKAAASKLMESARFRSFFYNTSRGVFPMGAKWADRTECARMVFEQAKEDAPKGAVATMLTPSAEPDLARIHRVLVSGVMAKLPDAAPRKQREARKAMLLRQQAAE